MVREQRPERRLPDDDLGEVFKLEVEQRIGKHVGTLPRL